MKKTLAPLALAAASIVVLAGCSTTAGTADGGTGRVQVVASTNVYGSLAAQIGGDRVEVTSLIASATKDPHSYDASARDRLAVQNADLVIENGGGYDSFMTELREGSDAKVVTAVEHSHDYADAVGENADDDHADDDHAEGGENHADETHTDETHAEDGHDDHVDDTKTDDAEATPGTETPDATEPADDDSHEGHDHVEGVNEHVWFDVHTIIHVAEDIAAGLAAVDPDGAADYEQAATELTEELAGIEGELDALHEKLEGQKVFITEPLPGLLAASVGLDDVAPDGFASAVEEGNDVAPATLLDALGTIESGEVSAVLANAQTGGGETARIEDAAKQAGIPVVAFTELLEADRSYAEWMRAAISNLATALGQ